MLRRFGFLNGVDDAGVLHRVTYARPGHEEVEQDRPAHAAATFVQGYAIISGKREFEEIGPLAPRGTLEMRWRGSRPFAKLVERRLGNVVASCWTRLDVLQLWFGWRRIASATASFISLDAVVLIAAGRSTETKRR